MQQYHLGFISDELLFRHVQDTVERYRTSIDLRMFNHNVVDPIKLTFDAKVYGKDYHELIESECIRQIDKSNTNHIGYFHQNLFRYIGRGWSVPSEGFDLINEDRHIFVELKNKHNTMNSSSATATYARMQHQESTYPISKKAILELVPMGGDWRDLPLELQKEYMGASFYLGGGKTGMARRLSLDEPSLTLTCSPAQKQTERCHPLETRPLSIREYARIQTFPDDWVFAGSVASQYKQIGNAVPVNLAWAVGRSLVRLLNDMESAT